MEYKGKRNSRKIKTAVIQNRRNEQCNTQFCKSINILPIKIQGKFQFTESLQHNNVESGKIESTKNLSSHSNSKKLSTSKPVRNTLTSMNLPFSSTKNSLKLNSQNQNVVPYGDQIKQNFSPKLCLGRRNSNTSIFQFQDNKLFQKLHQKKQIMMFDQSRLIMEANKFKTLLNDFQNQLKQANIDREIMNQKIQKYEHYFKQMKLKNLPSEDELLQQQESNHQLKILNLQKKVETLNFIIKQYRQNNKEQIKNFQSKLKEFKPNIQFELTQKLAEANQKYFNLLKKVQFFQKECQNSLGNGADWKELMREFQQTKVENEKNIETITQLNQKIKALTDQIISSDVKIKKSKKLEEQNLNQKETIQKLTDIKFSLQEEITQKQVKMDQLNHKYQENLFKLQGMKNLCERIENKEKTIRKNTVMINRLQSQNIELKTKMETVVGQFQARVFCQKTLQQKLKQMNQTVNDVIKRIYQSFGDGCSYDLQNSQQLKTPRSSNRISKIQKESFLQHLFEKLKASFNQIIKEYQNQLKLTTNQCQEWKSTFDCLTKHEKNRTQVINKLNEQILVIEAKRFRCSQSMQKTKIECSQCQKITVYWGQLSSLYDQVKNCYQKISNLQKMKNTQKKQAVLKQVQEDL